MTYEEIYNQALQNLCLYPGDVEDYRPAVEMHIEQLKEPIPNGIVIWLKNGSKLIYVADSREETNKKMTRNKAIEEIKNYKNYPNGLSKECRDYIIKTLEQEPRKGHWILTDVEGDRVWYCHCSECGKDPQKYIGGSENWWLIKNKLPEFCPCCGSDNREAKK